MKVLVTGAGGQVGSELIQRGEALDLQMLAAHHRDLDIADRGAVFSYFQAQQPHIVINAAAYTAVDQAETKPELAFAVNRDGAECLALASAEAGIPLLQLSTDYVYNGNQQGGYVETDTPDPQGVYGKSKLAGDIAIASILQQHLILRVSWVFGAHGNNFVGTMLRLARERDKLSIVFDQHGGPTWAGAIADTLLGIVQRWGKNEAIPWGVYHYSGQPTTTWLGFAEAIFAQAGQLDLLDSQPELEAITSAEYPTPAKRPLNSELNCNKIAQALGVEQPDWRNGLEQVLRQWAR